ncbi:sugar kinase [Oleiphilus sp. HI0118]|nr:sugar kinase [Oleiphilus sp. HI0118]KZZ52488.1 sugar kinase [Oleiphilus sp. HI0118]
MPTYHVYGLGAALVDTEIEVNDDFLQQANIEKGLMTLVDESRQHELLEHLSEHLVASKRASGGSACNSIIAASYFGAKAFYSCKVAKDENGEFFKQDLKAAGVDTDNDAKHEGITGKCLVMITPDAERTMNTYLGISETLSPEDINERALKDSEWAYIEGYLVTSETGRAAAIKSREIAEQSGVKTALSLSDPGMVEYFRDGLSEMIGNGVDLLFCNKDEALGWTNTQTVEAAADAMKQHAKSFAITLGKDGAIVFDGETLTHVEGASAKAIDTNGAGDMFAGAFLYALTHGQSYPEAARLANQAAARVVSQFGPRLRAEQHAELLA